MMREPNEPTECADVDQERANAAAHETMQENIEAYVNATVSDSEMSGDGHDGGAAHIRTRKYDAWTVDRASSDVNDRQVCAERTVTPGTGSAALTEELTPMTAPISPEWISRAIVIVTKENACSSHEAAEIIRERAEASGVPMVEVAQMIVNLSGEAPS